MSSKNEKHVRNICENRKARHDYHILETFEAGIVLLGSEVKASRDGKANLNDSFITDENGEMYLLNCHISEYKGANRFNHEPKRKRKLLMKHKEINRLIGKIKQKGLTMVPLKMYFNSRNFIKVEVALVQGKANYDKREAIKERDWNREKQRILKNK
ncbi:MAG: SsrA-binding protein SmpB [Alphaproteobacteria bacterium]|nr:SsrA-binding protein SmpB [Alphaproteobacteria bacterium]OJV12143.1 MAG: SsrA-binding protein [Alphaproteobacteria bacterium 33-17]